MESQQGCVRLCYSETDSIATVVDLIMFVAYEEYRENVDVEEGDEYEVEVLRDGAGQAILKVIRKCLGELYVVCVEARPELIKMLELVRDIHDARQLLKFLIDNKLDIDLNEDFFRTILS